MHFSVLTAVTLPEELAVSPREVKKAKTALMMIRALLKLSPNNVDLQLAKETCERRLSPLERTVHDLTAETLEPYGMFSEEPADTSFYWDYFKVGGSWSRCFLVKEDCRSAVLGIQNSPDICTKPAPEGYLWVAGARKCDIAWDKMKEIFLDSFPQSFEQLQAWFRAGKAPEDKYPFVYVTGQGIIARYQTVYQKDETLEQHRCRMDCFRNSRYFLNPFAFAGSSGGESCDDLTEEDPDGVLGLRWHQMVHEFIAGLPEEAMLVSVDCHR